MTSNDVKLKKITSQPLSDHYNQSNLQLKPIWSGIKVIFSPNNGDFRRFQLKLTKIDVKKDVK